MHGCEEKRGILQFVSRIEAGFWYELSQRKLEKYKPDEDARGYYTNSEYAVVVAYELEWAGPRMSGYA